MEPRSAFVHEAALRLGANTDPRVPGAAVTTELCGHWEHQGGCRWPHDNEIWPADVTIFRTIFVASAAEADEVHTRIELALRLGNEWIVITSGRRPLEADEQALAGRLAGTPLPQS